MTRPLLSCLLALLLGACSTDDPAADRSQSDAATTATVADASARVRLGMVFSDSDPWMAGAVIERGRIRVGDRLFLLDRDPPYLAVRITAIRDDATQSDVTEASASQGVFLSFRAEPAATIGEFGPDRLLVADPGLRPSASEPAAAHD